MAKKVETEETTAIGFPLPRALGTKGFDTVQDILKENLGAAASLSFSDLTKIAMPAGGGTVWEIPTSDGKYKNAESIDGVVVAFQDGKAYWSSSLEDTGGGSPPDCRSNDMIQGHGNPGIICSECPFNEYGSAQRGIGKACKDLRILYVLTSDSLLPKVIVVPPTSLKAIRKAFLALAVEEEIRYYGAVLSFTLEKDKSAGGITFSRINVAVKGLLDDSAYGKAAAYNTMLEPMLNAMTANVIENKPTYSEEDVDSSTD